MEVIGDARELLLRNERSHLRIVCQTRAEFDLFCLTSYAINYFFENILFNHQPRTGTATLAVIEKDCVSRPGNRRIEIARIPEDNIRRFAAEFEAYLFRVSSSSTHNYFPYFRRTGESNFVHIIVAGEGCTRSLTEAGDNVHDAFGDTRFEQQFSQSQRAEGSLFGGFKDGAIPRGQSGGKFPSGHEQREIPGNDLSDYPYWLPQRKGLKLGARSIGNTDGNGIPLNFCGPTSHIMKNIRSQRNICHAGNCTRFAIIKGFHLGEFVRIFEQQIAHTPNEFASFAGGHPGPGPGLKSLASRAHSLVYVFAVGVRHASKDRTIRWIKDLKEFS